MTKGDPPASIVGDPPRSIVADPPVGLPVFAKNAEGAGTWKANAVGNDQTAHTTTPAVGTVLCSATVTTTKKTLIVIVGACNKWNGTTTGYMGLAIRRGGVDKHLGAGISSGDAHNVYAVHIWGWEILDMGTYQYDLVANDGSAGFIGATIKAVAVEA